MDSDGFCVTGAAPAAPSWKTTPQTTRVKSSPALENEIQTESSPALQNRLEVEFRNHLLRIDAENITLRDTLKAISARTGAEIQFPAGELGERIFVHLGPGSARDVVTELLNGSQFNYVILSLDSEPSGMTRLILSRSSSATTGATSNAPVLPAIDPTANQLYGAGFSADADAASQPTPSQEAGTGTALAAPPAGSWVHNDGAKLSGEQLDQMQKMQIQQEQQEFAQQLQQQRQQQSQEPPSPNPPPQ